MKLIQNILKIFLFSMLLLCTKEMFGKIWSPPQPKTITLQNLDAQLQTLSTAPIFKIKNCWYGRMGNLSNLTDIVQQSLQQHADKGKFAFPANMNQYFGKDPLPGIPKNLFINFKLNNINYKITIPENDSYLPTSEYLYKIPEGTINPLLTIQQTSETPEDLTAYLAQFNTKEEIENEITRIKKEKDDMIWAREHVGMTETVLIKFNAKMDEFNAKIKALQDKLATFVQSQPDPSSPWPPAGNITYTQLRTILEMNNNKSFKINRAAYHSKNVTEKFQTSADLGILYMPQNLNAVFGDPAPGNPKLLAISFTMNQQEYTLALSENWFTSSSTPEWLKTPNQYITFEQTTQQQKPNPEAPEDLTAYLAQFNTKEEIEAEIKRLIDIGNHTSFVLEEQIKFDAKLKALRDKLATLVPSQQGVQTIELKDLFSILKANYKKPFKIDKATATIDTYFKKDVTSILQKSANLGLFYIPKDFNSLWTLDEFLNHFNTSDPNTLNIYFTIVDKAASSLAYNIIITTCDGYGPLNDRGQQTMRKKVWNIQDYYGTNDPKIADTYLITTQEQKPDPGLISIESLTVESFKKVILDNDCQSFVINNAWYGTSSKNIDVTAQMQKYANDRLFVLPKNMNAFFGKDPVPGISKTLFVDFTIQNKRYTVSIPESNHDNFWIVPVSDIDAGGPYIKNFMSDGISFQAVTF